MVNEWKCKFNKEIIPNLEWNDAPIRSLFKGYRHLMQMRLDKSVFFPKEFKQSQTIGSFPCLSYRLASIRSKKSPPNGQWPSFNMGEDRKIICTSISNTADNDNGFPS
jgi:hypothetical protein